MISWLFQSFSTFFPTTYGLHFPNPHVPHVPRSPVGSRGASTRLSSQATRWWSWRFPATARPWSASSPPQTASPWRSGDWGAWRTEGLVGPGGPRAILLGGYSATVSLKLSKYLDQREPLRIRGDCNPYITRNPYITHIIPYISESIPYKLCGMHPQLGAWECSWGYLYGYNHGNLNPHVGI